MNSKKNKSCWNATLVLNLKQHMQNLLLWLNWLFAQNTISVLYSLPAIVLQWQKPYCLMLLDHISHSCCDQNTDVWSSNPLLFPSPPLQGFSVRQKEISSNGGELVKLPWRWQTPLPCCAEFIPKPKMQALNDAGAELLVGLDGRSLTGDLYQSC